MVFADMRIAGHHLASIVLTACLLSAGCQSETRLDRLPLTGKVTQFGIPVESALLSFLPLEQGPAASAIVAQGEYRFTTEDGPMPGKHRVVVTVLPVKMAGAMRVGANDSQNQPPAGVWLAPGGSQRPRSLEREQVPGDGGQWEYEILLSKENESALDFELES